MRKPLAGLTILLLAAGVTTAYAAPSQADPAPVSTSSVTVFLKASDPAGLAALAGDPGLSRQQRLAALGALVPSDATHRSVAAALRAQGYAITAETTWSITAEGAAATSTRLFGRRSANAGSALPHVPAALGASVSAAFPTTGGAAVYRPRTADLVGTDFRNANTAAGRTPSTGQHSAGATVATLQLSSFATTDNTPDASAADLSAYARKYGLPDPVSDGQYRAVQVDGGADDASGYSEVNLDQQSILSTAPTANQHAYFAPNTTAGYNDVFAQVYDDVVGTRMAKLPDPHIVAMSVSWGDCESRVGASAIRALEPILQSLAAAGVTVFAASGDDGIYDCGPITQSRPSAVADVDFPASSPWVVGVGGTHLRATSSAPNTGTNWTETAWKCGDRSGCQFYPGGSGGGASGSAYAPKKGAEAWDGFPAPAYQRVGIGNRPFRGNAKRLVPDIATAGDPQSGFATLHAGGTQSYGGTSLAAPVAAAQFTNALADAGRKTGVGDIHGALYSAYRLTGGFKTTNGAKAFRDITAGTNGATNDRSTDPSVAAGAGYDTVTGLGAPLWTALIRYLLDTRTPTATVTFTAGPKNGPSWRSITAQWTVLRGADTSLVGATAVRITQLGKAKPVLSLSTLTSARTITAVPGASYQVTVIGHDLSGRAARPVTATVSVPLDNSAMPRSAGWVRQVGAHDIGGSNIYTTTRGATARATGLGRSYTLRMRTGPSGGLLGVYLNGKLIKKVDQRTAKPGISMVRVYSGGRGTRTFTFKALTARVVHLDALYITY